MTLSFGFDDLEETVFMVVLTVVILGVVGGILDVDDVDDDDVYGCSVGVIIPSS